VFHDPRLLLRRCLFIGINMGLLILVYVLTIQPLVGLFYDQADRLVLARSTLSKYRVIADREEMVRAAAARASEVVSSSSFLQGASEGAANANLQARLKAIAEQAGARVQSVRALESGSEGGIRYLKAHLELAGPVAAIYATLRAIEGRQPYLFVGQALLRMLANPPADVPTQEPTLEVQLDVYGPVHSHAVGR
jgi:general secretion pathway protein M